MELKKHAASCKGVEELFEKEEMEGKGQMEEMEEKEDIVTRQGSWKGQGRTRSEMAAEERQLVITRCPFLKNRVREVNVFNVTKEGMSRSSELLNNIASDHHD